MKKMCKIYFIHTQKEDFILMKKFVRIIALLLAVMMVSVSLIACGDDNNETTTTSTTGVDKPVIYDPSTLTDEQIYDAVLGEYYDAYAQAKEAKTVSERFALMAIAEAKMLEAGVMLPMQANGGNYAISKVVPYSVSSVLWGNDEYREHNIIVADKLIEKADRDALKALWKECAGEGTYQTKAREYLTSHGYGIQTTYSKGYTGDPTSFDVFASSEATDAEVLVNTYDGLLEYDCENILRGALAESWSSSEDGLKWTFKLRKGVKWVDVTGTELAEVKADDFVAGFNHMLDDPTGGLSWLVDGVVAGVTEYINGETEDFGTVGVKALDDYTVEYTLTSNVTYFETMFSYGVFAPLCRAYYVSLGGEFGMGATAGTYGTSKDTIAYNGPYLISTMISENTIVFTKNPSYWNAENVLTEKITWVYNDGKVATQAYEDFKAGKIDGCGLNTAALELAKADGNFEKYGYVSGTDATSFPAFFNVYRRGFANFNKEDACVSAQTEDMKARSNIAMFNANFRMALALSFDRGSYMAQTVGDDLKYTSMVNSYTPGTFVKLDADTTVVINGTAKTYKAGTFYGQIMQDQITADGFPMKVFDATADGGIGSSGGYDGWYNTEKAAEYLNKAIAELAADGIEVSEANPIHLDFPYQDDGDYLTARANVVKTSIETALGKKVIIDLVATTVRNEYLYATYYFNKGSEANYNIQANSGWGPDYGDPSTYLDTMIKGGGYMLKCLGLEV